MTPFEKVSDYMQGNILLSPYAGAFTQFFAEYDIDPAFALATFILETGWGRSELWINGNNASGIICTYGECYGEYQMYATKEEGIRAMFDTLQKYIDNLGLTTVDEIRSLWSQTEDSQLILQLMEEINK